MENEVQPDVLFNRNLVTVGISEMAVSNREHETLVTHSLGSCIGLTLFDPVARVGGLVHSMMPLSTMDSEKARANPLMFVDTGVATLLQAVFDLGARRRHLVAKVAGASQIMDENRVFRIGERNYTVLRKILWKNNILITGEDIGGTASRTMYLCMATGVTTVRSGRREMEL